MLQIIIRSSRLGIAAGLAAAWLLTSAAQTQAAVPISGQAARNRSASVLPIQAPAPGPNIEASIAQLHQRLQITPAQEPRFAALVNVMRENAQMTPSTPPANSTAVDDLRLAIRVSEQEVSGLKRLLPPLEALYASLSPAQQQTANQMFRQGPSE
jgi:periplasmic protein CpxP/Spy